MMKQIGFLVQSNPNFALMYRNNIEFSVFVLCHWVDCEIYWEYGTAGHLVFWKLQLEVTQSLHCKYPRELHTIPYNFIIRNCMEPSRRLFFISLGAADFVTYDQREVFFPTPFCQENVITWKQTKHDRVGRPKPAKMTGFSSFISEISFLSIWSNKSGFQTVGNKILSYSVLKDL